MEPRRTRAGLLAAYVVGVLLVTLTPVAWTLNRLTVRLYLVARYDVRGPWSESVTPEQMGTALNVLLFVPLGAIVVLVLRRHPALALVAAVVVSSAVELVQLVPAVHRQSSLSDVVANGLGGLLGGLLARVFGRRRAVAS